MIIAARAAKDDVVHLVLLGKSAHVLHRLLLALALGKIEFFQPQILGDVVEELVEGFDPNAFEHLLRLPFGR